MASGVIRGGLPWGTSIIFYNTNMEVVFHQGLSPRIENAQTLQVVLLASWLKFYGLEEDLTVALVRGVYHTGQIPAVLPGVIRMRYVLDDDSFGTGPPLHLDDLAAVELVIERVLYNVFGS
ncbi:unnamed protein product [Cuscuta epithymum]|uniref:Uncharacterized protein n=1 Tax=Cuscuta epithymum TaxID=186058 RepID=A0AAV0CZS6_9ASTE|nr:unnamed protein product [Cuscuta epithymum]